MAFSIPKLKNCHGVRREAAIAQVRSGAETARVVRTSIPDEKE